MRLFVEKIKLACVLIARFSGWLSFVNPEIVDRYISEKRKKDEYRAKP